MAINFRRQQQASAKIWLSLVVTILVLLAFFAFLFEVVPYVYLLFLSYFVFVFVGLAFLISYFESKYKPLPNYFPSCTIVIPAYNSGKFLRKCLDHVLALKYPSKVPIWVCDDASQDDTGKILREYVKRYPGRIRVVTNKTNLGKAASQNRMLAQVKTETVATIDSDTYPASDALMLMAPKFEDKKVGAVASLVTVHNPKNMLQRVQQIEYLTAFGFWHSALAGMDCLFVTPGPMSLYRMKAVRDVGGYDEENITEDMEIALHLQQKKWRIELNTDAVVETEVPHTLKTLYRQRLRWLRGKVVNGIKYHNMLFNSEYGTFGKIFYPLSFAVELISVIVSLRLVIFYAQLGFSLALQTIGIAKVDASLLSNPALYTGVSVHSSTFLLIVMLAVWGYVLWTSLKIAKDDFKFRYLIPALIGLTFYSVFIALVYFSGIVHEFVKAPSHW